MVKGTIVLKLSLTYFIYHTWRRIYFQCAHCKEVTVLFEDGVVEIFRNSNLLATGEVRGKLYVLKMLIPDEQVNRAERSSHLQLWHYRLSHLGMDNVNKMMNEQMVDVVNRVSDKYGLLTKRQVKMAGYWPRSLRLGS